MHRTFAALAAALLCSASAPAAEPPLWIAVLDYEGRLVPVARHDAGGWSRPWPGPKRDEWDAPPPPSVPEGWWGESPRPGRSWRATSLDSGRTGTIHLGAPLFVDCGARWAVLVNGVRPRDRDDFHELAVATSRPIRIVPFRSISETSAPFRSITATIEDARFRLCPTTDPPGHCCEPAPTPEEARVLWGPPVIAHRAEIDGRAYIRASVQRPDGSLSWPVEVAELWLRTPSNGAPAVLSSACERTACIWMQEHLMTPLGLFELEGHDYALAHVSVKAGEQYVIVELSAPGAPVVATAELGGCC